MIEYNKWIEPNGFIEHRIINGKEYIFENFCSDYYDEEINILLLHKSDELDGETIGKFDTSPFSDEIAITIKKTKEEIEKEQREHEELMKYVEDKSYRNDTKLWKVDKYKNWYWNTNYDDLDKNPSWVKINENFEAIILKMNDKTDNERCRYRNCSFGSWGDWDDGYSSYVGYRNKRKRNFKIAHNPKVYKYTNKETNEIDYVGIVWSENRKLSKRIKEHSKYDEINLEKYDVYYFEVETKADAEVWEGHLITYYETQKRLNKSKSNWGLCTFLKGKEDSIEWIKYEVDNK